MEAIAKFYVKTLRVIISFVMNSIYFFLYLTNGKRNKEVNAEILRLKSTVFTVSDVERELKAFKWVSDPMMGVVDWSPNIYSFIFKNKQDDCDGAAAFTKWLFDAINLPCTVVSLVSKKPFIVDSHVIAISKISNTEYALYSNGNRYGTYQSFNSAVEGMIDDYHKRYQVTFFDFFVKC
jgi:hypothetical protein